MKNALCVGVNKFLSVGEDLKGCVNDANKWRDVLVDLGFNVTLLLDEQATKANILKHLNVLRNTSVFGDEVVYINSSHGTKLLDKNGDEEDGYDEALYVYDGAIRDDDLRVIFNGFNLGVHLTVIFDTCFSKSATRVVKTEEKYRKPRFIETDKIKKSFPLKKKLLSGLEEEMTEVFISACGENESAYDAFIDGEYQGAFSAFARDVFKKGQSFNEFYTELIKCLPNSYFPQTPSLEGKEENKKKTMFINETSMPEPEPEEVVPEKTKTRNIIYGIIFVLALAAMAIANILR
jgi:hypothetical protein